MATGFSPRRRAAFSLVLATRWSIAAGQCHFEDSDGRCWEPEPRGVCGKPEHGASALIQHADVAQLCTREPPYGFRPMCTEEGAAEALKMVRELRDPATCHYRTCALVGASGTLLGARLGSEIDKHDAVIRINFAPDGTQAAREVHGPHAHAPTWVADIGARTTWRVLTMEGYGYLRHYPRFWLKPPKGHGEHDDMSGIPQHPLLAIACHTPSKNMGRCRTERLRQVFAHPWSASYLINPVMMNQVRATYFTGVRNQKTLSTGMTAIAFAQQLCGQVHLYGFGNGSCGDACYHYYDCGPTAGTSGANQSRFLSDPRTSCRTVSTLGLLLAPLHHRLPPPLALASAHLTTRYATRATQRTPRRARRTHTTPRTPRHTRHATHPHATHVTRHTHARHMPMLRLSAQAASA